MILLFIFIIGCFVTAIVTMGLIFAMAAVGYGAEGETLETQTQGDSEILPSDSRETNGRALGL